MSARVTEVDDGFTVVCTDCHGEGRSWFTFQGAEKERVQHSLPGACKRRRRVESAVWNGRVMFEWYEKLRMLNGNAAGKRTRELFLGN